MIILLDSNGIIFDANTYFLNTFNYEKDEIIGKNFQQLENVSLEASSVYKKKFKEIFDNGILEPFELQAEVKGDFLRWMSIQSSLIDIDGKKLLQVIFQDINDRKEAEQKLRESEEKYRIITENANDLIAVINEKFRFEYLNEEVHKRITGYSKEDLIGRSPLDNFHPDDIKEGIKAWRDGVTSGEGTTEYRYKKKDGTWIWFDMRGKKFIDTDGEPKGIIISRDITERKITEQRLKESEQKYRHLFESSPYSIGILDLEGILIESNEATNKFLSARTKDELIGKNIREIFSSNEQDKSLLPKLTEYVKEVVKNEIREPLELPITRSIGDVMWISFNGSLINIGDKTFLQFLGQDITDRKRAEQELKKSEEKYRHLFESSPYFIGLLDQDGTLLDCNNAVYQFLSIHTKDDVLGTNINKMLALNKNNEPLIPLFQENFKRLLRGEVVESFECQLHRSIGDFLWMNVHGSLLKIEDSLLILFIIQDITEKKKAEQEIKKSEQKYRLLFENSPNAIILANSKGIILDFNYVTEKLMGIKRDELIGKNYTKISAPENVKIMKKRYEDHLKGILLKPIEYEVKRRDGSYIWVNFQNKIIKLDDEDISIAIIQDITKRKEAELLVKEELIKLKELDQIRKDLISRVSHELKTPLIPVISGTELLTTIYRDQVGEDAIEIIDMIDKGGARLKELVEKLINVSRIEYNKFEVRKESFNLSEIIKRSANGMKFLVEQRKLKLKCEIPDKLYLEMDELRIEEVITNLLSNAIKNTPPHGEINLNLRKEDRWAILTVSDTGVGLTEKEKNVLFTRFGKIERYEEGLEEIDVKGSGLGLYICKEIIKLHGGQIWAESEGRNKGSIFNVKLPI
jgi:PAS domain S-box-containing protein